MTFITDLGQIINTSCWGTAPLHRLVYLLFFFPACKASIPEREGSTLKSVVRLAAEECNGKAKPGKVKVGIHNISFDRVKDFPFFTAGMVMIMYIARAVLRKAVHFIWNCQRGQEVFKEPFARCFMPLIEELASKGASWFLMTLESS